MPASKPGRLSKRRTWCVHSALADPYLPSLRGWSAFPFERQPPGTQLFSSAAGAAHTLSAACPASACAHPTQICLDHPAPSSRAAWRASTNPLGSNATLWVATMSRNRQSPIKGGFKADGPQHISRAAPEALVKLQTNGTPGASAEVSAAISLMIGNGLRPKWSWEMLCSGQTYLGLEVPVNQHGLPAVQVLHRIRHLRACVRGPLLQAWPHRHPVPFAPCALPAAP